MTICYTTDLTHFLDERGSIPACLPKQARKLAETFGEIVASVTAQAIPTPKTNVTCWNTQAKNMCNGRIHAGFGIENFDIIWHCPQCNTHGSITNWENTFWDCGYDECINV